MASKPAVVYISYGNPAPLARLNGSGQTLDGLEKAIQANAGKKGPFIDYELTQPCAWYELVIHKLPDGEITAYHVLEIDKTMKENARRWPKDKLKAWVSRLPTIKRFDGTDYKAWIEKIAPELNLSGKVIVPNAPARPYNGQTTMRPYRWQ